MKELRQLELNVILKRFVNIGVKFLNPFEKLVLEVLIKFRIVSKLFQDKTSKFLLRQNL